MSTQSSTSDSTDSTSTAKPDSTTNTSSSSSSAKLYFPPDKYLLTQIHAVPALSDVSPAQALSYLNQMLENLLLFHQPAGVAVSPTISAFPRTPPSAATSTATGFENSRQISSSSSSLSSAIGESAFSGSSSSTSPPGSPKSDIAVVSPLAMNSSAVATLRTSSAGNALSPDNGDPSSPHHKSSDIECVLEEAASVAAAVISDAEYKVDAYPRVNVPSSSQSDNGLQETQLEQDHTDKHTQEYSTPDAVKSRNLKRKAVTKDELSDKVVILKRFLGKKLPDISVWNYLLRMHHYCPMSTSVYLSASLYVYRLCINLQTFVLTPRSVHRLILATLRTASKITEDINFTQKRFATVSGITTMDLYRLEIAFLFLIDFDVCIDSAVLQHHLVVLTELQVQADRYKQALRKRPRTSDIAVQ